MQYDFSRLGPDVFERLVQSLLGGVSFGDGPDGQREAVVSVDRLACLPGVALKGYTVAQAKYKSDQRSSDKSWLRRVLCDELDRFEEKKQSRPELVPGTWLFITNVVLTPVQDTGLRDWAEKLIRDQYPDLIPQPVLLGADDLITMLDREPAVAASYAEFLTPSHVLVEMKYRLDQAADAPRRTVLAYVRKCFFENHAVRLEQAGDRANRSVDIRNVFTDLRVSRVRSSGQEDAQLSFAAYAVELGDKNLRKKEDGEPLRRRQERQGKHMVLLGDAGQGKSTVCQLLCQLYRAALLRTEPDPPKEAESYCSAPDGATPLPCPEKRRIPVTVELKRYAAWLIDRDPEDRGIESYLRERIEKLTGDPFSGSEFRELLRREPWLFCLDGLDEVAGAATREEVLRQIQSFRSQTLSEQSCDALLLCTSRPQGYDFDLPEDVFAHFRLQPLTRELALNYVQRLLNVLESSQERREEALQTMREATSDPVVSKLITAPLYVAILLLLVRSNGALPGTRYSLFQSYCAVITEREKQKKLLPELNKETKWVLQLHREIAMRLHRESDDEGNPAAELGREDCIELIRAYLQRRQYQGDLEAKALELYEAVTGRLPFLCQSTDKDLKLCVFFSLRSIQEYYAAESIVALHDVRRIAKTLAAISRSAYWRNVFLFAVGCFTADLDEYYTLNDVVYDICRWNMGDPNHPRPDAGPERELLELTLPGAWLALDLLCDGVLTLPSDQSRFTRLLEPLLRLQADRSRLSRFRRFPPEAADRLLTELLLPMQEAEPDADSLGFLVLWDMAGNGDPRAGEALKRLCPRTSPRRMGACAALLEGITPWLGNEPLAALLRWTCEDHFSDMTRLMVGEPFWTLLKWYENMLPGQELPICALRCALYRLWASYEDAEQAESRGLRDELNQLSIANNQDERVFFTSVRAKGSCLGLRPLQRTPLYQQTMMKELMPELHRVDWQACGKEGPEGVDSLLETLLEKLEARGLPELAAILAFQNDPTREGLGRLLRAYEGLEDGCRGGFCHLMHLSSWYLDGIAAALRRGTAPAELLPEEAAWPAVPAEDARLRWIQRLEDLPAVQAKDGWDGRFTIWHSGKPHQEEAFLEALEKRPLRPQALRLLVRTSLYRTEPDAFGDSPGVRLILDRMGELDGEPFSGYLYLTLFAGMPYSELAAGRYLWPARRCAWRYPGMSVKRSQYNDICDKLQSLLNGQGWTELRAYALVPMLGPCTAWKAMPFPPLPAASGEQLEPVLKTGNRAALFGWLLSRMTGEMTASDRAKLQPMLAELLGEDGMLRYLSNALRWFSADGRYLLFRVVEQWTGSGELGADAEALRAGCARELLSDLELKPVRWPERAQPQPEKTAQPGTA